MPLKTVKSCSFSANSVQHVKWNFLFRRFCSKSEPPKTVSSENAKDPKNDASLIKFEYPEARIKPADYMKPISHYFIEDVKNSLSRLRGNVLDRHKLSLDVEFLIIGAGPIGCATAFWLSRLYGGGLPVLVVDKNLSVNDLSDSDDASRHALLASVCSLKQEYELKENVELSQFGAQFIRNMPFYSTNQVELPRVSFQPSGFLTLSHKKNLEKLKKIHSNCLFWNGHNELLTPFLLNQRFPWLNTDDIEIAMHGLKDEGWFDPNLFLMNMRALAIGEGARFFEAEPTEFVYDIDFAMDVAGFRPGEYRRTNSLYVKLRDGEIRNIRFAFCIIAVDDGAASLTKEMLHLDKKYSEMHHYEFPIIRRKRRVFHFSAPEGGPSFSSPTLLDPTGLSVKRYGPLNEFVCECAPIPGEKSPTDELSDREFFDTQIWPLLAARIPLFETLHYISAESYYEDFSLLDGNGFIGPHPAYHNFIFAIGFGDRIYQHGPGIGLAIAEASKEGFYRSIDLSRFTVNRLLYNDPLTDSCVI